MRRLPTSMLLISLMIVPATSCDFIKDDGSFEPVLDGKIYNSNDGSCSVSGEDLSFFFDGEFVATVAPGQFVDDLKQPRRWVVEARVTDTGASLSTFDLTINRPGWYAWSGCQDGTHP